MLSAVPPLRIGFIAYDGLTTLDLVGPLDAFAAARLDADTARPVRAYELVVLGLTPRTFVSESGLRMKPHTTLDAAPRLDTILIPGGAGIHDPRIQAPIAAWLRLRRTRIRRMVSVCTGVYGLAASGLLDGRRVTTHWQFADDLATRFPKLRVDGAAIFCKDGRYYTSAGITAGIDLSLSLIEEDHGPSVALAVARELVVYVRREGGQAQYSAPFDLQIQSVDRLADLVMWMRRHPEEDLCVESLARRAGMSPRQLSRQFKQSFGASPAGFVEELRLGEAQRRLLASRVKIEALARSVGFASDDSFRRAFERRFGIAPSSYRARFSVRASKTIQGDEDDEEK
jgi:transcriptional regulator GlxA family with amidase domain